MADGPVTAVGKHHRPAVEEPPQVAFQPAEVVALAVHHREAKTGRGEPPHLPVLDERVLDPALPHAVVPLPALGGVAGLGQEGSRVVGLPRGARRSVAHEVDLAGADHDVVAQPAGQDRHHLPRVLGPVRGEVDGGVEGMPGQEAGEVLGGPVAPEPLHSRAEGIGEPAAVEEGDPVAGGQEPPDQLVADEPRAADDEDVHGIRRRRPPHPREDSRTLRACSAR